jgi:PIN domain nuclease of toxin-antitoxin system
VTFVVDTHVLLWYVAEDPRLSQLAINLLEDTNNRPIISIASLWEIAIKTSTGKLNIGAPFREFVAENITSLGIDVLEIKLEHLEAVSALPFHHRDPFDRLIIAQCLTENLPLLTDDGFVDAYAVKKIWSA